MSQTVVLLFAVLAAVIFFAAAVAFGYLYITTKLGISREIQAQVNQWIDTERENMRQQQEQLANQAASLRLDQWKATHSAELRQEAIKQSQAITIGKVTEHIVPYMPDFTFNPKDVRFLGSPIDLIVFDGLSSGEEVKEIVFVEVKINSSNLSKRERLVREAVTERKVKWQVFRPQLKTIDYDQLCLDPDRDSQVQAD